MGKGSVLGEGVRRAGSQREQNGGDAFPDTTDTSIRQQYRTAFCALKHTRSSYEPAINMDSGLSIDTFFCEALSPTRVNMLSVGELAYYVPRPCPLLSPERVGR